ARRPDRVARRVAVGRIRLTFRDRGIRLRLGVPDTRVTFLEPAGYAPDAVRAGGIRVTSSVTTPTFADLSVGDEAPPLVVEDLSPTQFVRYAGASGDFTPMHHEDTIATSVGNPSVFGHGMLTAGLMARVLKDWFGPAALRRYQVRFSKQVWPGETLTCTARVAGLRHAEAGGIRLAPLQCPVLNPDPQ